MAGARVRPWGLLGVRVVTGWLLVLMILLAPVGSWALGTSAGTLIANSVTVAFLANGVPSSATSNVDNFRVDEVLGLTLVSNDGGPVAVTTPDSDAPLSYTLTNTGNAAEPFRLVFDNLLLGDGFDPENVRLYLDDGDALFDGGDVLYALDMNNPLLAADAAQVVFVVADIPAGLTGGAQGDVRLTATAQTGSGSPGTAFDEKGEGGVDAVVGATTATAVAQGTYRVEQLVSVLSKSVAYAGVAGPGTVVTYTLVFDLTGVGTADNLVIRDPVPAATTYVPGSLTWNAAPLTDAADADAGVFTGSQIEVRLGALAAPATETVSFQVTIN